jgi:hypothetical protein
MDVTQRALEAFPQAWRLFAGAGIPVQEKDGLLVVATGGPAAFCNQVIVTSEPESPSSSLAWAVGILEERELPFLVQVPDGSAVANETGRFGLKPTDPTPFMTLSPINEAGWRRVPRELLITPVRTKTDVARLESILSASFGMDAVAVHSFGFEGLLTSSAVRMFLGWVDGHAVTTATVASTDGAAGVFSVGTLEAQRGKGLGEVMTAHAIRAGAEAGADIAYLQASPMGFRIYERMGFKTVTNHIMYMRP